MGCVSAKAFRRGAEEDTWYLPMSRNVSATSNQRFREQNCVDHSQVVSFPSSFHGKLDAEICHGSFLNIDKKARNYKLLPSDTEFESFTFTSSLDDVDCRTTYAGAQPNVQGNGRKHTSMCNDGDFRSGGVQNGMEPGMGREHYLMSDYLNIQDIGDYKSVKSSLWEHERKGLLEYDDNGCHAGMEWVLEENGSKSAVKSHNPFVKPTHAQINTEWVKLDDEQKSLLTSSDCGQDNRAEIINMKELMESLDDDTQTPSPLSSRVPSMLSIPERQISFNAFTGPLNAPPGDLDSPVWKKYYMQENGVTHMSHRSMHSPTIGSPFDESPRRAPSQSSFLDIDDARSISSVDVSDMNAIGLKILLSPTNSSFYPSPVNRAPSVISNLDGNPHGSYIPNVIHSGNTSNLSGCFDDVKTPHRSRKPSSEYIGYECLGSDLKDLSPTVTRSSSRRLSMESTYGSGSPLFNPSLMATFEEALRASMGATPSHKDWLHLSVDDNVTFSSSAAKIWGLFDTLRDAESIPPEQIAEKLPITTPSYELEVKRKSDISSYEIRCPPRGEGKVVLYFTSLRGIRKTFEDCCNIRLILRGLGVQVDERDVWMHSSFRIELNNTLNGLIEGAPQVPQLFIKGRYIGGAQEVKQLHEEGILACLMDGLAMGLIHSECNGCGDARFIPCFNCSGSRKVWNVVNEVSQCLACNENGLTMCPMCIT